MGRWHFSVSDDGPPISGDAAGLIQDLLRLDRYERRAWSRQKRAINQFSNLKAMRAYPVTSAKL
jgi:hypothetical protein